MQRLLTATVPAQNSNAGLEADFGKSPPVWRKEMLADTVQSVPII